jgi:Glycosyl hydrolase family 26
MELARCSRPNPTTVTVAVRPRRRLRGRNGAIAVAATLLVVCLALTVALLEQGPAMQSPIPCVAPGNSVTNLETFGRLVRRPINCAAVYIDATTTWEQWVRPWFFDDRDRNQYDWVDWYLSGRGARQLVITQPLIPSSVRGTNWVQAGASGAFERYSRTFATNLVHAGLGGAVIRLAPEANGNWNVDSVGSTPSQLASWVEFWRKTVIAMRSVKGAQFKFDWCVNAGYRAIPLASFYPGDDVVDYIGVDAYDVSPVAGASRLQQVLSESDGLIAVAAFARAHHKQMSIPEWGIAPAGTAGAVGDDPAYVDAIARATRTDNVAYQAYFYSGQFAAKLNDTPRAVSAYRQAFSR